MHARETLEQLYRPFLLNGHPILFMDIASAEMTKYAANAMLATRISYMNDIANLCGLVGADINQVRRGIGSDPRIGKHFLYPGIGYGGSCFPKDVKALMQTGREYGYQLRILDAVEAVNEDQKKVIFHKVLRHFDGDIKDKKFAVWGLSFKPNTDDMREAPSLVLIRSLLDAGATVSVYDPVAMEEALPYLGSSVTFADDMYVAAEDAAAILLVTEWNAFRMPDWQRLHGLLQSPLLFDGRNIYDDVQLVKQGFTYYGIGNAAASTINALMQ